MSDSKTRLDKFARSCMSMRTADEQYAAERDADLDRDIRWRPIGDYDREDDAMRLFCARGYIYIGNFDIDDDRFEDWEGCEQEPSFWCPLTPPGGDK